MSISNKFGAMVVTTGNKSEMSVGYATLYGDMNGGFNPIKDLYKMEVFRLCELRNRWKPTGALGPDGEVIPPAIITKPPSAELRENQKDEDSLPPYPVLDGILRGLVEKEMRVADIIAEGYDPDTVRRIERLLYLAEYKRRQSAPGVKVGPKNFGRDRRYPIVNRFRDPGQPAQAPDASIAPRGSRRGERAVRGIARPGSIGLIGLFLDQIRAQQQIDLALDLAAPVIGAVDRAGQDDESLAEIAAPLAVADFVLDVPEPLVDRLQFRVKPRQRVERIAPDL